MPDLFISEVSWNSLDSASRERIKSILVDCKLLGDSDRIVYSPLYAAPAFTVSDSVCKAACAAAEAVASGACAMLPSPADVACVAAAKAAGELCKSACTGRGDPRMP